MDRPHANPFYRSTTHPTKGNIMTSNISSITVPVPSSEDYTAPESTRSRIAEKWARMPRVDANGFAVATQAETNVVDTVPAPGQPPRMADALIEAAKAVGADPAALVDSEAFMVSLGPISPADSVGLREAITDAVSANPSLAIQPVTPGMRPNPAQGASSSGSAVPSRPKTVAEMIRAQASKAAGQPVPPGSTTY
jgi:hypothetical protein